MDALTLKAAAYELNTVLKQARIEKIYQPSAFELVLKTAKGTLLLSVHPTHFSAHITSQHFDNPPSPTGFVMLLRKHLSKGYISDIQTEGFERLITINIENTNEMFEPVTFKLIAELMGKHSNIILVDQNNRIADSIKRIPLSVSRVRQVLPGLDYEYPPASNNIAELDENYQSFNGIYKFTKNQLDRNNITVTDCLSSVANPKPCIAYVNDKPKFPLSYTPVGCTTKAFSTMSEMLDFYYSLKDCSVQSSDTIHAVNTILKRLHGSAEIHKKALAADGEKYRLYGELLTSYGHSIKSGASQADVLNYYTNETITIPLDSTLSPQENAQKYYKRYSKIKAAKTHAAKQLQIITEQTEYLEDILVFLQNASAQKAVDAIKQQLRDNGFFKQSKKKNTNIRLAPIKYVTDDGFSVSVGRNSLQNDELTTKKAKATDIWCHVKDIPGSHVIIHTDGKQVSDNAIMQACSIAAYHSKAKSSANVPVDYTLIKYVKKPAHSLPGKVIFTNQKTVYVTPDAAEINRLLK